MTLLEMIQSLKTKNVKVTVSDENDELITFFSQGIEGVEGDLSARPVKRWELTGAQSVSVILDDAP